MRHLVELALTIAILGIALNSALASSVNVDAWFLRATAFDAPGTLKEMATPDFLCGKTFESIFRSGCDVRVSHPVPYFYGEWELLRYDRKHHIALAEVTQDQLSMALFNAPMPALTAPDADLSQLSTGRGLRIGSTYAQVLSLYGPPVKHGRHFVTSYSATFPTTYLNVHKPAKLHERITLVIDDDRVSSIAIYIQCCNG
jgi:hypothetical protein